MDRLQIVGLIEIVTLLLTIGVASVNALLVRHHEQEQQKMLRSEIWLEVLTAAVYIIVPVMNVTCSSLDTIAPYLGAANVWLLFVTWNVSVVKNCGLLLMVRNPLEWAKKCPLLDPICMFCTGLVSGVQCLMFWGAFGMHESKVYAAFSVQANDTRVLLPYLAFVLLYVCVHITCSVLMTCHAQQSTKTSLSHMTLKVLRSYFCRFWVNRMMSYLLIGLQPLLYIAGVSNDMWLYHATGAVLVKVGMLARMIDMRLLLWQHQRQSAKRRDNRRA